MSETFCLNLQGTLGKKNLACVEKDTESGIGLLDLPPVNEQLRLKKNRRSVIFSARRNSLMRLASRNSFFSPVMIITNHELIDSPL